jgi:hypothetical protein
MLRRYVVSAEYLRFLEAQLIMAIHDTRFDQRYRALEDDATRARWSKVPADQYDADKVGETAIIEIGTPDVVEFDETNPELPGADVIPLPPPFRAAS